ncbi:peptidyl-prolyl cis-trans isomerase, EpsD family [Massilia glaciei]|uniref:peptidylprolyl isomerase n=2 Tax=Massilia glaciei TaxID=1524097 RepID=A0A2U2HC38_9BURK|nr:peptidyl-prolyl cis-trans isomerase, EpsD family [Massilia glaciei]
MPARRAGLLLLACALALGGCGERERKAGQALASVNGTEITVLQLNEELALAGVPATRQDAASKQLLEALIDRQLLEHEAAREKLDRDPKVVQAIERAKALIVAQAWLQKRIGQVARPTKAEVQEYYFKHPQFFSNRTQFDMKQLVLATADLDAPLKRAADAATSLDEVATWMEAHKVRFARGQISRTSSDLPPELTAKLAGMPQGQLFIIKEGERSMLVTVVETREAPVSLEVASGQIEQFLLNKRNKEAADAEIKRLRAVAKIEYLGAPAPEIAAGANERGVAGLK